MHRTILLTASLLFLLTAGAFGQTARFDTVYTPSGYPGGAREATIVQPAVPNGGAVILLHGRGGSRTDEYIWCDTLAAHGYLAMAIDYPDFMTADEAFPAPARAVKTAVEFLRRGASRFGISPGRIFGMGRSFGALVLGQSLVLDREDALLGTDPAIDDALQGAVLLYGAYDLRRWLGADYPGFVASYYMGRSDYAAAADVMRNVGKIAPPLLLLHGDFDGVMEVIQSMALHDSVIAHGGSSTLVRYHGADHMFDFGFDGLSEAGLDAKDRVLAFLDGLMAKAGIAEDAAAKGSALCMVAPNPCSSRATISYAVPASLRVTLSIHDLLGREVIRLHDGVRAPGSYSDPVSFEGLPSGTYYYALRIGDRREGGPIRVVRQ